MSLRRGYALRRRVDGTGTVVPMATVRVSRVVCHTKAGSMAGASYGMGGATRARHGSGLPHVLAGGDSRRAGRKRWERQDQQNRQMPDYASRRVHSIRYET